MYNNNNYASIIFLTFVVREKHYINFDICHIIFKKSDKKK